MMCQLEGCEAKEWMARGFCRAHWSLVPPELQTKIRAMLAARRFKPSAEESHALMEQAREAIGVAIAQQGVAAEIGIFRTHMASVAGVVAALRTIPVDDVRLQLSASAESLERTDPDGYQQQRNKIEMDLEILELLGETREQLGALIKRWQPVMAPEASE